MDGAAPTANDLLAHTDWLHRLARALVGDAAAGDVVQETYEVALAQPPRRGGPLRPWLGGVARNIARMRARGQARRARREDQVAAPVDVPTPEDLVARAEMQQQVARVVLELDEPLRATLLLRFFEGMTAAEIARAQGIPAATVRWRLKDALDRVRATLDRRHGGDRRRWVVLVAPLPVAAAGKHAAAATLVGGVIVKTKVIAGSIVAVLVLALAARWGGLWGGGASRAADGTSGSRTATAVATAAVPRAPTAGRLTVPVYDDDPRGALRLEGQVIDDGDQPVPFALVAVDANPPIVVETDASGSFAFDGLISRDYEIEATKGDGYAGPVRLRLAGDAEPVTLRLRRGGAIDVLVVEKPGGRPIAGADVELRSALTWRARTDGNGVAQLRGIGAVWAPLAVRAPAYSPAAMMLSASGDPAVPQRVTLALARGAALSGRIVDETGAPVAGARVVATSASEPFPVVDPRRDGVLAGADGAFSFPSLAAGTWRISATHGDYAPAVSAPLSVDGVAPRTSVELALAAGGVVRGIVRDTAGAPVAAADVSIVVRGHIEWRARRQALTGADGRFAITGLPRRPLDVVAWHASGASAVTPADLAAAREHDVALALDVTGVISGIVVDRTGAPIGDAQVTAAPESYAGIDARAAWTVRGFQQAVTDQGGGFRFVGLPAGAYRVRAARPGALEAALSLSPGVTAAPRDPPIKLVLASDGRAIGKVALPDGSAPRMFTVAVGAMHPHAFGGKDGAFALPTIAGTHELVISGPGFASRYLHDVVITESKDTDLGTITVAPGRSITGRVLDAGGAPIADAHVAAGPSLSGGGSELYIKSESPGARDVRTDDRGRFTLDGFPAISLTVLAGKDGLGRSESIRIPPGPDSATLDLVLRPTAALEGKITRSGAPLPDTIVIVHPIGAPDSAFFVHTGPDGIYTLDALAPGPYLVYPMLGGGGARPKDMFVRTVEVTLGARARADIDATPGTLALALTAKLEGGGAAPPMMLFAARAALEARSFDELRDGTRFPSRGDVIPIYVRPLSGALTLTELRPGLHTFCLAPAPRRGPEATTTTVHCTQAKVDGAAQKLDLVVPASLVAPPR